MIIAENYSAVFTEYSVADSERPKVVSAEISAETEISAMTAETESEKGHIFFKFDGKNIIS